MRPFMRKLVLGVLAYLVAGSAALRAQNGPAYQEPLAAGSAIQSSDPRTNPFLDGPPPEPNEPYLVQVGNWKPRKGYTFYGSAEYLFWWMKGQTLPGGLSLSLSDPGAALDLTTRGISGRRFFVGMWLDENQSK